MHYLGVLVARYLDWCDHIQPRLPRWVGKAVLLCVVVPLLLGLFLLPKKYAVVWVLLIGFSAAPALVIFSNAHSRYWTRRDEIKQDALRRTLKIRDLLKKGGWK